MVEDAGRGYRRVVASPRPVASSKRRRSGPCSTRASSWSPPVAAASRWSRPRPAVYRGVEAVVDKDLASALLGASLGVSVLLLSTGVEKVAIRFRKPDQRSLERVTVDEARQYLAAGEFPAGSMGPKIEAAIAFLEHDGREVVITSPDHLADAVAGRTGTHITAH